jgi:hypothetical protein
MSEKSRKRKPEKIEKKRKWPQKRRSLKLARASRMFPYILSSLNAPKATQKSLGLISMNVQECSREHSKALVERGLGLKIYGNPAPRPAHRRKFILRLHREP